MAFNRLADEPVRFEPRIGGKPLREGVINRVILNPRRPSVTWLTLPRRILSGNEMLNHRRRNVELDPGELGRVFVTAKRKE